MNFITLFDNIKKNPVSKLDEEQLGFIKLITQLPFSLSANINQSKILTKAYDYNQYNGIYYHYIYPDETLYQFFDRIYGDAQTYDMNDLIFVQLIAICLKGNWPDQTGGSIQLYSVPDSLWEDKADFIGCITTEKYYHQALSPYFKINQWIIKIGYNQFFGLSENGVIINRMDQWVDYICEKIDKEITFFLNNWTICYHKDKPAEFYDTGFSLRPSIYPCREALKEIGLTELYLGDWNDRQIHVSLFS